MVSVPSSVEEVVAFRAVCTECGPGPTQFRREDAEQAATAHNVIVHDLPREHQ